MYRRKRVYYVEDIQTGQQESLHTKDPVEATRLLNAKNETTFLAGSNLHVARAYMIASDPHMPERDWQEVVDFIIDQKAGPNKHRWKSFSKDKALKQLWKMRVVETRADQLLTFLKKGTVSTNVYLRRLHNFAFDMNWLPWPILAKRLWPKVKYADKRGITPEEHEKIIARETNPERRDYYEVLWHTGGSQTDVAHLHAEDIDWSDRTIFYRRKKSGSDAMPRFGDKLAAVLARLPKSGPLFLYLITVRELDRATEFKQRCDGLGIKGITLHCYRYGWAESRGQSGLP
jgi:integrase